MGLLICKLQKVVVLVSIVGMCLIATSTSGFSELTFEFWRRACVAFSDGMGVMYMHEGKLHVSKSPVCDPATLLELLHQVPQGTPVCVHLREATFGSRTSDNLHPHLLDFREGTLAVMHNGSIQALSADAQSGPSDTQIFVQQWLREKLVVGSNWMCPKLEAEILQLAGDNNRFAMLDSLGNLKIIGEYLGFWRGQTWLSNKKVLEWGLS